METKMCSKCGMEKPISCFRFINRNNRKGYFDSYCAECSYSIKKIYMASDIQRERRRKYMASDIQRERRRKYDRSEIRKEHHRNRRKQDHQYRLTKNIRTRIYASLIGKRTVDVLGCSFEEFRNHLEKQFKPGMTWENHGRYGWHIDHKVPVSWFDLTDPKEFAKANHYTNFQPMWAEDNLHKGNRWSDK